MQKSDEDKILHYKEMFENFKENRTQGMFCDITLTAGDKEFRTHKLMLAAASQYFVKLFSTELSEKGKNVIELKGISPEAVEICIDYIYKGQVDLSLDSIEDVLFGACLFQLWNLKKVCFDLMETHLGIENCLGFWELSKTYEYETFKELSEKFLYDNIKSVLKNSEELCQMGLDFIKMCLQLNSGKLADEVTLYDALTRWVKFNEEERKSNFCHLLQLIRLPLMESKHLCDVVSQNTLVTACAECVQYYIRSLAYQIRKGTDHLEEIQLTKRGIRDSFLICEERNIFSYECCLDTRETNELNTYHYPLNQDLSNEIFLLTPNSEMIYLNVRRPTNEGNPRIWIRMLLKNKNRLPWVENVTDECPNIPSNYSCTCCEDYLIVIGGNENNESVGAVYKLDLANNRWGSLGNLKESREDITVIVVGKMVYVIGGCQRTFANEVVTGRQRGNFRNVQRENAYNLRTVECINIDSQDLIWKNDISEIPHERLNGLAILHNGDIYVMGGDNRETAAIMDIYNIETNSWTSFSTHFLHPRNKFDIIELDGKLMMLGGNDNTTVVEEWDDEDKRWTVSKHLKLINSVSRCQVFKTSHMKKHPW